SPIHAADGIGIRPLLRPVWAFAITRSSSASAARMLHLQTTVKRLDVSLKIAVFAGIAQLVEQLICNQQVAGSSPVASSRLGCKSDGEMAERSKAADCKSAGLCPTEVRILLSPPSRGSWAGVTQG